MESFRSRDHCQEKVINAFLDTYFFRKKFNYVHWITDSESQYKGIDVIADGFYIDIKAQSSPRYINNPRGTFILELSFLDKNNNPLPGWFINNRCATTMYSFVWINSAKVTDGVIKNPYDIEEVEVLLVDKIKLKEYINKWRSDDDLWMVSNRMRSIGMSRRECTLDGVHLSHTMNLVEKPTNLVVQKWLLEHFKNGHYIVTKTSINLVDKIKII